MSKTHLRSAAVSAVVATVLCLLCGVLLWPVPPGHEPWSEEVTSERLRQLSALSGRITGTEASAALGIVDPAGVLDSRVHLGEQEARVRFDLPRGESLEVAIGLRQQDAAQIVSIEPHDVYSLAGRRILLDPGHRGGAWSKAENRHVLTRDGGVIREGDLNYGAAWLLKERLELVGADVRLTRPPPAEAAYPEGTSPGYDPELERRLALRQLLHEPWNRLWLGLYPARLAHFMLTRTRRQLLAEDGHSSYNRFDLRRRSAIAEQWNAELTLSLHHNLAGRTEINGIIVFVPGNFLIVELDTAAEQYYAVRRAFEGKLPVMIELGKAIAESMQRSFDLPALPAFDDPSNVIVGFTNKLPIDSDRGVYARNLAVLRRTPGPVLLLEGPCMNHAHESRLMRREDVWIEGKAYPERVREYSDAVFDALLAKSHLFK